MTISPPPPGWFRCRDGTTGDGVADIQAPTRADAAVEYVEGGDYSGEFDRTLWIHVLVADALGDERLVKVRWDPPAPRCRPSASADHDWVEGAVRGSGGGISWVDECAVCALVRETTTWGTDPQDGEQGIAMIRYHYP